MQFAMFYHSLISDWNNGNAHFLRGITAELLKRGHQVDVYEPAGGWSMQNLIETQGQTPVREFFSRFPMLQSIACDYDALDFDAILYGADVAIVHEWNEPRFIDRIASHRRRRGGCKLLFHDTHHRCATQPRYTDKLELNRFDGVLAFGRSLAEVYLQNGWNDRVWTWHEAADATVFQPDKASFMQGDLVWVGNWGDEERTAEIAEYLVEPAGALGLATNVYGVRYPQTAINLLGKSGLVYNGWLANYKVPEVFNSHRVTVHIPRKPYGKILPGIPTIRPFEALACGIPLIMAPWEDTENLFTPGKDYLVAHSGHEMKTHLRSVINEPELATRLAEHGRRTILARHTCAHRVIELLEICREMGIDTTIDNKLCREAANVL
ncbi:MAG: glycosyltransferase [Phycisphaerae bacterium]|nr:glycosyltransferase [Phycisphaerae bacterium]